MGGAPDPTHSATPTIALVERRLAAHAPWLDPDPAHVAAAVAMVLCEGEDDLDVLFVRRAEWEGDPWSGHLAFPGGRIDPEDLGDPRRAAERETLEELALDLRSARLLGRLSDVLGRAESVRVSCFVYAIGTRPTLHPNYEIREAFWVPLRWCLDPRRQLVRAFRYDGRSLDLPAIRLLEDERAPVLWGITYKLLEDFMRALGSPIPVMPWDEHDV